MTFAEAVAAEKAKNSPAYCAQMVGDLRCTRFDGHQGACVDAYGNSTTECAFCSTEVPDVDPTRPQFCSDECKAEYASEQPGYRSDRDVYREEAPYGVE